MKQITLPNGKVALVDDEDFERVNAYKWGVLITKGKAYVWRYVYSGGKRKGVYLHREIMDTPQGMSVDHIDGDGLNNQKSNMRNCTHQENLFNERKKAKTSSIFKGVWWDNARKRWAASLRLNGKTIHLGRYDDEVEAALAYNSAAIKNFGKYSNLNAV